MKRLIEFINEELDSSEKKAIKKLYKFLNEHTGSLEEYVDALNDALKKADKGDNAKYWMVAIKYLFDGEHGKDYKAQNHVAVKVTDLYPTQSEIDIENSAKWITKDWGAKGAGDMFKKEAFGKKFPVPVLVYKTEGKYWIIDGHHRWSQIGLINRDASLDCLVVTGPEKVQDFLKITQGAIASVLASDNKNNGKKGDKQLPVGSAQPENNIFGPALKGDKLKERISKMCTENLDNCKLLQEALTKANVIDKSGKFINESQDNRKEFIDSLAEHVMKNRDKMLEAKQNPPKWAEPRPVMPQSDAAGPNDPKSAKDGNPENEGSALYKILHKSKFPDIS